MNRETIDLALLFSTAFIGATILFLAALITFTFHHEIRERLVQEGLIIPSNGPQNPALRRALEQRAQLQQRNAALLAALEQAQQATTEQRARNENRENRNVRVEILPAAIAAWQRQRHDPWAAPPDPRPHRLATDGTIWAPHPQYLLDWDQPLALEQQPIMAPPAYRRRPTTGESTLAGTSRRHRGQDRVPFPTPRRAIGLPSTSNDDPAQTSDTDTLVDRDVPEQIRIRPDVPEDIPANESNAEDQRTSRELLTLDVRGEEDPFNVDGPDFEWPEPDEVDRDILGAARLTAWEFRRRDVEDRAVNGIPGPRESMGPYLALNRGEPLDAPNATSLSERLELNANREIWDPAAGRRLLTLRPRTAEEQGALEHALACIVWQEIPWRSRAAM